MTLRQLGLAVTVICNSKIVVFLRCVFYLSYFNDTRVRMCFTPKNIGELGIEPSPIGLSGKTTSDLPSHAILSLFKHKLLDCSVPVVDYLSC